MAPQGWWVVVQPSWKRTWEDARLSFCQALPSSPSWLFVLAAGEEAYKEAGPLLPPESEEEDILSDEELEARK